jgi:hypothetical protein
MIQPCKNLVVLLCCCWYNKNIDLTNEQEMEDSWLLFGGCIFEFDSDVTVSLRFSLCNP